MNIILPKRQPKIIIFSVQKTRFLSSIFIVLLISNYQLVKLIYPICYETRIKKLKLVMYNSRVHSKVQYPSPLSFGQQLMRQQTKNVASKFGPGWSLGHEFEYITTKTHKFFEINIVKFHISQQQLSNLLSGGTSWSGGMKNKSNRYFTSQISIFKAFQSKKKKYLHIHHQVYKFSGLICVIYSSLKASASSECSAAFV